MIPYNLQKIVNEVKIFDKEASDWLCSVLIDYFENDNLHPSLSEDLHPKIDNVNSLLVWDLTPQGHAFWNNIRYKIRNLPKMNRNGANKVTSYNGANQ